MTITHCQRQEIACAARLLVALGYPNAPIKPGDRPDEITHINGRNIGIEVTQFHSDVHARSEGSRMRAAEEALSRQAPAQLRGMWIPTDPLPGLVARIQDKIARATAYDPTRYDELWLLISSQVSLAGFLFKQFVDESRLNDATHSLLTASPFAAVHLHLVMTNDMFSWSREKKWYANQLANGQVTPSPAPVTARGLNTLGLRERGSRR